MRQLKITKQVTNRETASLDKYLQEIGKVDLITADEEVELAQRIKAGDQIALGKTDESEFTLCGFCGEAVPKSRFNLTGLD
jgi:DNA-directed RNA polymerase sigma subunit (sigma70/sigma32)